MLENHLIINCKNGDGEAFRRLMATYNAKLLGYLLKFSDCNDTAEEMFQETMIKAWKGIRKYNDQKKFSSWLFTIAHNVAMDSLRYRKNKKAILNLDEVTNQSTHQSPDDEVVLKETVIRINNSVQKLSDKQKQVFTLRQHGELSFKEIAKIMNEPLNTVLSHMRYAVKKIKKQLDEENETRRASAI